MPDLNLPQSTNGEPKGTTQSPRGAEAEWLPEPEDDVLQASTKESLLPPPKSKQRNWTPGRTLGAVMIAVSILMMASAPYNLVHANGLSGVGLLGFGCAVFLIGVLLTRRQPRSKVAAAALKVIEAAAARAKMSDSVTPSLHPAKRSVKNVCPSASGHRAPDRSSAAAARV